MSKLCKHVVLDFIIDEMLCDFHVILEVVLDSIHDELIFSHPNYSNCPSKIAIFLHVLVGKTCCVKQHVLNLDDVRLYTFTEFQQAVLKVRMIKAQVAIKLMGDDEVKPDFVLGWI